jgi:hypothetical protein
MDISILILLVIISLLLIYLYVKYKYGFWFIQPVFHIFDISYLFFPPGIIQLSLPERNKYTNLENIETLDFAELPRQTFNRFAQLIRLHFLQNNENIYNPGENNIMPYFNGHNSKSFISLFYEDIYLLNKTTNETIKDKKIIGVITSRPLNVYIKKDDAKFEIYYADYLCVHKNKRKQGISPQLIQTHHYNQRHVNKSIVVSLFKREEELTGIIPLCVYSTYGFSVKNWVKPNPLAGIYNVIEVTDQNIYLLFDFININKKVFEITIISEITNILELIKTNNIFIYITLMHNKIIGAYFYRKSCVEIEKGLEVLSNYASILLKDADETAFIQGFKISFWEIAFKHHFGFCAIENISHNNKIINDLMKKTKPMIISPTAYFFYNFAYPTFKPEKCLIIH